MKVLIPFFYESEMLKRYFDDKTKKNAVSAFIQMAVSSGLELIRPVIIANQQRLSQVNKRQLFMQFLGD